MLQTEQTLLRQTLASHLTFPFVTFDNWRLPTSLSRMAALSPSMQVIVAFFQSEKPNLKCLSSFQMQNMSRRFQ